MPTTPSILSDLKSKGTAKNRITFSRHGHPIDRIYGVSIADLKLIAKTIKHEQALAMDLYATNIMDAMYLAGLVASGASMTRDQLQSWAEGATGMPMIADHTVPWVTVENLEARDLAKHWIASNDEYIAATGWRTYSGLLTITPDEKLHLKEIESLLNTLPARIHKAPNRTRSAMNNFIIATGTYVAPLLEKAKATAATIGPVSIDVGDTDCKVSIATESIAKAESTNRIGKKKKTIRC